MNGFDSIFGDLTGGAEGSFDFETLLNGALFPVALVSVILCIMLAFYGYKIFKLMLVLSGALGFGVLGNMIVAPLILNMLSLPAMSVDIAAITGFVFAIIGALLINFLYKLAIFVSGAAGGYFLGQLLYVWLVNMFPDTAFLYESYMPIVVGAVCGLILGILFVFFFKYIYIISTSFGGMIYASILVLGACAPTVHFVVPVVIGAVIGIFAAKRQFSNCDN